MRQRIRRQAQLLRNETLLLVVEHLDRDWLRWYFLIPTLVEREIDQKGFQQAAGDVANAVLRDLVDIELNDFYMAESAGLRVGQLLKEFRIVVAVSRPIRLAFLFTAEPRPASAHSEM